MKRMLLVAAAMILIADAAAFAQTKHEKCDFYARQAMQSTPTSTGVVRGAARGAVGGAIFGDAGAGAGVGAIVGGARKANQKSRSYRYYYDSCMAR